jgi:membrane-associated protease RseP (regulator of RpoE activity)
MNHTEFINHTEDNGTDKQDIESAIFQIMETEVPDFSIYEYALEDGSYFFYGNPPNDPKDVIRRLWVPISSIGYDVRMVYELGEYVLVICPVIEKKDRVWVNVVLASLTVITTMFVGSMMFGIDPFSNPTAILKGLPFTLAIMFVLGSHEMGHYIVARIHGMKTSLPYFIPFPSLFGTMGAVIKHKGPIPNRKALFDVGVAGPIVGLIASIIVTVIGLSLTPMNTVIPEGSMFLKLSLPILFVIIGDFIGGIGTETVMHPVAFAGWVGMLVTALNLIPAGQLDGGHMLRAMLGPKSAYVSAVVPFVLLSLSLFIYFVMQQNGGMLLFWGLFIALFAAAGHPEPIEDSDYLGNSRILVGVLVFITGLLCVTLVPIQV